MDKESFLLEYLNYLNGEFALFLKKILPNPLPDDWWDNTIIKDLDQKGQQRIKNIIENINNYKIDSLLDVCIYSWPLLSRIYNSINDDTFDYYDCFNDENLQLFHRIKKIRNKLSHEIIKNISPNDKRDINYFSIFIESKKDADKILKDDEIKKKDIIEIIEKNVLDPPLEIVELNDDIKESLRNTKERIRRKNLAKDVYDFYDDALNAKRGKEIAKELKKFNGLITLEDIEPIVRKWHDEHFF
jgi:hypothetical protein